MAWSTELAAAVFAAASQLDLMVILAWACLSMPAWKNQLFAQRLSTEAILTALAVTANLSFCPGLLDAMRATSPPALQFFKKLPAATFKTWAVYVLVLEKLDSKPLVYIGSGTESQYRVLNRWSDYDRLDKLPNRVQEMVDKGFAITHKGVIVWTPIPAAANIPMVRLLFVTMEAVFAFLFWAMWPAKNDYMMSECCPWPLDSFGYGGLCTHSPLKDNIEGDFDRTAEELEQMAVDRKDWAHQRYLNRKEADPDRYAEIIANSKANMKLNSPHLLKAQDKRAYDKGKKQGQWICGPCKDRWSKKSQYDVHCESKAHLLKVGLRPEDVLTKHVCDPCGFRTNRVANWNQHIKTAVHKSKTSAAAMSGNLRNFFTRPAKVEAMDEASS